jgi:hypothetical protein
MKKQEELRRKREKIFQRFQKQEEDEKTGNILKYSKTHAPSFEDKVRKHTKSIKILTLAKKLEQRLNENQEVSSNLSTNIAEDNVAELMMSKPILKAIRKRARTAFVQ